MKKILFILPLILLVVLSACRKDSEVIMTEEDKHTPLIFEDFEPAVELVNTSISGIIVDQSGNPLENVNLSIGDNTAITNPFGIFQFNDLNMNKKGTFLQAEKEGYFLSGRKFFPRVNQKSNIRIKLIEMDFSENFSSSIGGTINIKEGEGSTIIFQPNSIINNIGETYTGTVEVATTWLDPTSQETLTTMPGALQGVNTSNEEGGLITYGMLGVELRGEQGEELNIAEGSTAEIKLKVPLALQSTAPNKIPLWSFNYEYGTWVEEGNAQLENGFYVGQVNHFSFWNWDDFRNIVEFELTIIEKSSQLPLENTQIVVSLPNNAMAGMGFTNELGFISGLIPANEILRLKIISPCGETVYDEEIGPFSNSVELETIEIPNNLALEVKGEIIDCNGELVSNGVVFLRIDNKIFQYHISTNPFTINTTYCNNTSVMTLSVGDLETYLQSSPTILPSSTNIDLGTLAACDELLLDFMKITVDGTTLYLPIHHTLQIPSTDMALRTHINFIIDQSASSGGQIIYDTDNGILSLGDYSMDHEITYIHHKESEWLFVGERFENIELVEYGPVGTVMSGRMSGTLNNTFHGNSPPEAFDVYVEAEFRAIRRQM